MIYGNNVIYESQKKPRFRQCQVFIFVSSTNKIIPRQEKKGITTLLILFFFIISVQNVKAAAIAVPIVIAVVLFAIIFAVIKCTKIKRSAGLDGSSITNEVPLQPLAHGTECSPPFIETVPPLLEPLSLNNTEAAPPCYQEPLPTVSDPLPFSGDFSQGVTNYAISDETAQL